MTQHFQRYMPGDPGQHEAQIATTRLALEAACKAGDTTSMLELAATLGEMLTSARREAEAHALLTKYLAQARTSGDGTSIGWLLLCLATANQYLGKRREAEAQFEEALQLARHAHDPQLEHYVLHHQGRFLVEAGDFAKARVCFERALAIRVALHEPRQESTRRALDALARMVESR